MSSYVSGYYSIQDSIVARLRAEATRELRAIENEAAQLKAQHDDEVNRRQAMQEGYLSAESAAGKQAEEQHQNAKTYQSSIEEEAQLLLEQAAVRINAMEDVPPKAGLLETLSDMLRTVERFGVTTQNIEHIRTLVRETLPAVVMTISEQQEKERLEQELQSRIRVRSTVADESIDFVSMKVEEQQKKTAARPWDLFVSRVRAMAAVQDEFGGFGAQELLDEAESAAPGMRSLFMMQHEDELAAWEEEAAAFRESIEKTKAQQKELYASYLRIYRVYQETFALPLLEEGEGISRISGEISRIEALILERRKREYLETSFREVFEAHGLTFESMTAEQQNLHIEFAVDEESGVRVSRSESGAFEMVFLGKSAGSAVSSDQRRRICEKAKKFCDLMPAISADLQARGIFFDQRILLEAQEEAIAFETTQHTQRRSITKAKEMHMN